MRGRRGGTPWSARGRPCRRRAAPRRAGRASPRSSWWSASPALGGCVDEPPGQRDEGLVPRTFRRVEGGEVGVDGGLVASGGRAGERGRRAQLGDVLDGR